MASTSGPKTYQELFADPSYDPCNANGDPTAGYLEIFARWRSTNNAPTVAELHRDLLMDFDSPVGAVGFFVKATKSTAGVLSPWFSSVCQTTRVR